MTTPAARRRPPGRYDEPSLLGQRAIAILLVLTALAVVFFGGRLLLRRFDPDAVRGRVISFDIASDQTVRMRVEVSKREGSTAYCIVRARGADGLEVGREVEAIDSTGAPESVVRRDVELTTSRRAVTAELAGCRAEPIPTGPPSP